MTDDTSGAMTAVLEIRKSIDNLDAALIHVLAERFRCTRSIGQIKARGNLPAMDPAREEAQMRRVRGLAGDSGLDPAFAERIVQTIIREVVQQHEAIRR